MQNKYELKITELKAKYNKDEINYNGNDYVADTLFGLDIEKKGYNIYIEGPTGVRKNEIC